MSVRESMNSRKLVLKSLNYSYEKILGSYEFINGEVRDSRDVVASAEWLLDNIYLIEKEYKTIKKNMPFSYFNNLPLSDKEHADSWPRVYRLAHEYIEENEGEVKREETIEYINKFQQEVDLTLGELWALPLMLRANIIEKLSIICEKLSNIQMEKKKGEEIASKIIEAYHLKNVDINQVLKEIEGKYKELSAEVIEKLLRVLRDNSVHEEQVYNWILQRLNGESIKETIYEEHLMEGKIQVSICNCITSLRNIDSLDWKEIFTHISKVEKILEKDPQGTYSKMDFESKDYYRHSLENIASKLEKSEVEIAKSAIELSTLAMGTGDEMYKTHVGYYLVDEGFKELGKSLGYSSQKSRYLNAKLYVVFIILSTIVIEALIGVWSYSINGSVALWKWIISAIILFVPISEVVIALINWNTSKLVLPSFIPKLDLSEDIGSENKTLVVIPSIIQSEDKVCKLMEKLEVYHISNKDPNIYFAVLADFKDSKNQNEQLDKAINKRGISVAEKLNKKYGYEKEPHFYFFNRERKFNEKENVWMGWERKRGKIMEFMALLKGDKNTYNVISSSIDGIKDARYIITLDEDTKLTLNAGKKLIGAMAHVLNKGILDKEESVIRGYGIMQPKISVSIEAANKSIFSKYFSGETGIDIYTTAVSETYQDLFGEGTFTGKGIIDIDIFYKVLKDEIPENTVLSHDLLEGAYTRCALLTDVELIDGYPPFYKASCERLHRWVRGDWQLLTWLKNPKLNLLSKWKIFDNLRRSLLAPAIVIGLYLFTILYSNVENLSFVLLFGIAIPVIFNITDFVITPKNIFKGTFKNIRQIFLIITFIPTQARLMIDAICRTIYRLTISKKDMLKWKTAEESEKQCSTSVVSYFKFMWVGSLLGLGLLLISFSKSVALGVINLPISILWIFSPIIANEISKPLKKEKEELPREDIKFIREISRRTWAYYEDFVNLENNYLAPDNYQQEPNNGVAYRTSPTNIGMGLISNVVAYDLGYIGISETVERLEKNLDELDGLEKYHGHLLNWYDTKTKAPLYPRYISTVDSGNLVGYLWVIREALREYLNHKIAGKDKAIALLDTIYLVEEEVGKEFFTLEKEKILQGSMECYEYIQLLKDIKAKIVQIEKEYEKENLYWTHKLLKECENKLKETTVYGNSKINVGEYKELAESINKLINKLSKLVDETDFKVLFHPHRKIFSIGYDLENQTLGSGCYDLLASEARVASFMAIAKGDVPQEHWFKLGRAMTNSFSLNSLVSWSGTMFEYFMPPLIMKNYENTLWDDTYKSVIKAQKSYAHKRKIPWGISESAFYHFDVAMNYQYKAFGVPGIGLKRGLIDEVVVAPYASIMALPFDAKGVVKNLKELRTMGMMGKYGFYEALDFTEERVPKGKKKGEVKCFMVHHQGMALMALDNFLKDNILQKRFHSIVEIRAYEILLQERTRRDITFSREEQIELPERKVEDEVLFERTYPFITETPNLVALSNGCYSTVITNSGCGYSKKDEMMVYRWKEDVVQEGYGNFIYIKNLNSNEYWSNSFEPTRVRAEEEWTKFSLNKGEFYRKDGNIETLTEIGVSQEDNLEVRSITLKNNSDSSRTLELTSYMEVTLSTYAADTVHPTFSNLFIITEYNEKHKALVANRRPRAKGQKKPYVFQTAVIKGEEVGSFSYETSRVNFIGRNRDLKNPRVMDNDKALDNTQGIVLDPILSIRARVNIAPGKTATVSFITGVSDSKEEALELCEKYNNTRQIDWVFKESRERVLLELKYLGIKSFQANVYQCLASNILFLHPWRRERSEYIEGIDKHQKHLWSYGISGDLPIILLIVNSKDHIDIARSVVSLHLYWRSKGIKCDLVIYDDEESSYEQPVQRSITEIINSSPARDNWNKAGGVFLHSKSTMEEEIKNFLLGIARVVFYGEKGNLLEQSRIEINQSTEESFNLDNKSPVGRPPTRFDSKENRYVANNMKFKIKEKDELNSQSIKGSLETIDQVEIEEIKPYIEKPKIVSMNTSKGLAHEIENLDFYNGYGGFTKEGTYKILLRNHENTPAPWINVISNNNFGFHISESGAAYTWCGNSRENKITPWSNDWIRDSLGEALYIRDDKRGNVFSITPKPLRDEGEYLIEHGFGYSKFTHECEGIKGELTAFCSMEESVKYYIVNLENITEEARELTLFYYAEMVLGVVPEQSALYISTHIDKDEDFIWAHNPYSEYFGKGKAYLKLIGGENPTFTGDRSEFLGRENSVELPQALGSEALSNTAGGGMSPCLATSVKVNIPPASKKQLVVMLGQNESISHIKELVIKASELNNVEKELENAKKYWEDFLGNIRVKTPDKSMNHMLNGWLMYQTLGCRFWSRTAFYQSGGAYGFRDQLQDSLALGILNEEFTRSQILRNAARQYEEGDVQHWWHPVVNSGIRTRFSDDLLWLPYAVGQYIKRTGDHTILEERAPYLKDCPLADGEDERYTIVDNSQEEGTIYDHCLRALERGLKFGEHNIPLMGSGDWNDGMSTVGNEGKGESVWLGWFLYDILEKFKPLCSYKYDYENLKKYEDMQSFIKENLEENAWDGGWYRRAYFDDGTPLGSVKNAECSIDSLSQSWSAISGAGNPTRVKEAMEAVEQNLIKEDKGMILLLAPPFNNSKLEPGYIKGYVPGVRENGGQYTHAAVWVILALTKLGLGDKAYKYYNMINPINHSSSQLQAQKYKVEPYVISADVYIKEPHGGRGGWSWYTGASGWFYKVGIEDILGLKPHEGKGFKIEPCVPSHWNEYEITYKYKGVEYDIKVERTLNKDNVQNASEKESTKITKEMFIDGVAFSGDYIPYGNNEKYHILVKI